MECLVIPFLTHFFVRAIRLLPTAPPLLPDSTALVFQTVKIVTI